MVICVFGDSITWGAWDLESGGWVNRLRNFYDNNNRDIEVYNNGVDGDYVGDVVKRFDTEAEARDPDAIILSIGINDTSHASNPAGTNLEKFEESYKILLEKSNKFTKKVVIVGLTNVDEYSGEHGYKNDEISKFNETVKSIAKSKKVLLIDLFGILGNDEFDDGLHPNAQGHEKIFEKVKETLSDLT